MAAPEVVQVWDRCRKRTDAIRAALQVYTENAIKESGGYRKATAAADVAVNTLHDAAADGTMPANLKTLLRLTEFIGIRLGDLEPAVERQGTLADVSQAIMRLDLPERDRRILRILVETYVRALA